MATKDWRKDRESKNSIIFRDKEETENGYNYVYINKRINSTNWIVIDSKSETLKEFKTKPQALTYAKSYMRKN